MSDTSPMNYLWKSIRSFFQFFEKEHDKSRDQLEIFNDYRMYAVFRNETTAYFYKSQVAGIPFFNYKITGTKVTWNLHFIENIYEFLDFLYFIKAPREDVLFYDSEKIIAFIRISRVFCLRNEILKSFTTNIIYYLLGREETLINPKLYTLLRLDEFERLYFINQVLTCYDHAIFFHMLADYKIVAMLENSRNVSWEELKPAQAVDFIIRIDMKIFHKKKAPFDVRELLSIFVVIFDIDTFNCLITKEENLGPIIQEKIAKVNLLLDDFRRNSP